MNVLFCMNHLMKISNNIILKKVSILNKNWTIGDFTMHIWCDIMSEER